MEVYMKFAIIGGDLRIVKLAEMLAKENNEVYVFGLEKADNLKQIENIKQCDSIKKAIQEVEIVIGPIPFSSNGNTINMPFSDKEVTIRELMHVINAKVLIAGGIIPDVYGMANDEYIEIIDIMKREELAVLNTIATAEGTIQIAIENTNKILHGSEVLILGFGRIGKVLARKLSGLSAKVTCAARKDVSRSMSKTLVKVGVHIVDNKEIFIHQVACLLIDYKLLVESVAVRSLVVSLRDVFKRHRFGTVGCTNPVCIWQVDADRR